jgi:hypothetical protein
MNYSVESSYDSDADDSTSCETEEEGVCASAAGSGGIEMGMGK